MTSKRPTVPDPPISAYAEAVRGLHGVGAEHRETVRVVEMFRDEPVWEGDVHVFDVTGHGTASTAYAWHVPKADDDGVTFVAVLHEGAVDSPQNAVRAWIVQSFRGDRP